MWALGSTIKASWHTSKTRSDYLPISISTMSWLMAVIQGRWSLDHFQKVFESIHRKIKKCHVNTFFVHGGVKNRPGLIHKIIRVEKVYLMMPPRQVWGCLSMNWLEVKRLKNYQEFLKLAPGPGEGVRSLNKVFKPSINDVFHNHRKVMKNLHTKCVYFVQKPRRFVQLLLNIFSMFQ